MPATAARSEVVLLEPPERPTLDVERDDVLRACELPTEIVSPQEYKAVADLEERIARFIARAEPMFDEHCSAAHRVWKSACEIRSAFLDTPKKLKATCRALLGAYKEREARIRRDEERRLEEQQRDEARARQLREAKTFEREGQPELAAAVRTQPIDLPPVVLPSAVPDVAGLTFREDWFWEPVGGDTPGNRQRALSLLVRPEYAMLVKLDDAGLTAYAKRTKGTVRVPGIVFRSRQTAVRR